MSGTPNKPSAAANPASPTTPQGAAAATAVASPTGAGVAAQVLGQLLHHTAFNPDNTQRAAAERRLLEVAFTLPRYYIFSAVLRAFVCVSSWRQKWATKAPCCSC